MDNYKCCSLYATMYMYISVTLTLLNFKLTNISLALLITPVHSHNAHNMLSKDNGRITSVMLLIRMMGGCWSTLNFMCLMSTHSLFAGSNHVNLYTITPLFEFSAMTFPCPRNVSRVGGSAKMKQSKL